MGCSHDCDSCSSGCSDNKAESMIKPLNAASSVKRVIGVVSGKGGVGKSLVTAMLAVNMANRGYHAAVLDADITGPSIPKAFGISGRVYATEDGVIPMRTVKGIDIISTNLILENASDPVVWRGPVIAGAVEQFWTETVWDNVDYMFVDMPPGTGDVPLTVFQSLPLDGIIIVTSPQELVGMIVSKAVNMAKKMDVDIIGIVENMSYVKCPDCDKKIYMFGKSHSQEVADRYQLPLLGQLPIDSELTQLSDQGYVENYHSDWFDEFSQKVKDI